MKREVMLNKVAKVLDDLDNISSNVLKAETILFEIEKLGMLPPQVKGEMSFFGGPVYEWEE